MNEYTVSVSEDVLNATSTIHNYISDVLCEPITADKMIRSIANAISSLSFMPHMHSFVPDKGLADLGYSKKIHNFFHHKRKRKNCVR